MPTANSAAGVMPIKARATVRRRLTNMFLATGLSISFLLPAGLFMATSVAAHVPDGGGSGACSRWTSTTNPPNYIWVLRHETNRIVRVPFKHYVAVVLGKEWPSYLPQAVIEAGAVAVKQYAWYHAFQGPRHTRDGRCFTVRDGTQDQLYKPGHSRVRDNHYSAIDATWSLTLSKNDRFFMTGYRRGHNGRCGHDATGWKLFARTAARCAKNGKSYLQILKIYYGPNLVIHDRRR